MNHLNARNFVELGRKHAFVLGLAGAVLMAFLVPEWGRRDGPLQAGLISKAGVMLIFLIQGLSLRTRDLAHGIKDVHLHVFVQAWIFLFGAILHVLAWFILKTLGTQGLAEGFLFLALIPTTITSAVIMTSLGKGNVTAAIFNTSLSNILGVFWVPIGCLIIFSTGSTLDPHLLMALLWKLANLILIPFVLGQVLRPAIHKTGFFRSVSVHFRKINHAVILFIVFSAFSESVLSDSWRGTAPDDIMVLVLTTVAVLLLVHAGTWISSGPVLKRREDRVCALFCGSQKTLAAGAPMAMAIFGDNGASLHSNPGLLLLPLLCYHPLQLLLAAIILPRLEKRDPSGRD